MTLLLFEYLCINSTIELPIIIPSENIDIFLAASGVLIPNPTVTGILFLDNCFIANEILKVTFQY